MGRKAVVIGGGFSGLAGAALLARDGWDVVLLEKNESLGGRARSWTSRGYTFDLGPSWYLMPEVFDRFFAEFGKKREDYYAIQRLDPGYKIFFEDESPLSLPARGEEIKDIFARLEPGGDKKLEKYLEEARYKYHAAMKDFLYRDYDKVRDFFTLSMLTQGMKLHLFRGMDSYVRDFFTDPRARKILEYPLMFLGTDPSRSPALYSLLSHVDLNLGVWYPQGGMGGVVKAFAALAREAGVRIETGQEVTRIPVSRGRVAGVETTRGEVPADVVLYTGDYSWAELALLDNPHRSFDQKYWKKRTLAPSLFLAYLGVDRPLPSLEHHNLFFSHNWEEHFEQIFQTPQWPDNPALYLSRVTRTQEDMAPAGKESLFLLIPVAPGLEDSDQRREEFFALAMEQIRRRLGVDISPGLEVRRLFSQRDFSQDYHAPQGTALGLAHTLSQTAVFRPPRQSPKVKNLFYAGQYTHPGVGVPMVIISSTLAAAAIRRAG